MRSSQISGWSEFADKLKKVLVVQLPLNLSSIHLKSTPPPSTFYHLNPEGDWTLSPGVREEEEGEGNYVEKIDLNLYRLGGRLNREFFQWSGGPAPFEVTYIFHVILVTGLLIALLYLLFALLYHTMQKLKSLCPSFKLGCSRNSRGRKGDEEDPLCPTHKELPTPEVLEARRQERLRFLQKECQHLEDQLEAEKQGTLASRASDSDLEYLGYIDEDGGGGGDYGDSPPLKRNSISLQDIPQSVIRIRREKQLRQLKEEVEQLHALSQSQDLDLIYPSKSPLLKDLRFEFPLTHRRHSGSSKVTTTSSSPSPLGDSWATEQQPLSQRISHLKAQRKLHELRADLEGLALHLVHSDEIKAKRSSLQDIPKTALGKARQDKLMCISKEIENMKNYKLKEKSILQTVLPGGDKDKKQLKQEKKEILEKMNRESSSSLQKGNGSSCSKKGGQPPPVQRQVSEVSSISVGSSTGTVCSLRRTRQQELNRVRVELKELSYKLNLNYVFDVDKDREKMMPPDWPKNYSRDNSFGK